MKIALFSSTANVLNGYGNITAEYCRGLKAVGIDFTLFLPEKERETHQKFIPDIPARFELPPYIFEMKNPKALMYLRRIDLSEFDLVHSLFDFPYCFIAARSAKKYSKPFIMGSQGTYGVVPLLRFPDRQALMWTYRQANKIIVPSRFTRDTILKYAKRDLPIEVIHNGVNFARFAKEVDGSEIRSRYPGKMIFLTVGGLKERKGQDLAIRALAELKKRFDQFVYLLVGDGEWKSHLKKIADENGIGDKVIFAGVKDGAELEKYFHSCDVYVHTPRVANLNFEGFGIVYLEAGACGKPSVATDAGGVRDAVIDQKTGIIVKDGDIEDISGALLKLCRDGTLRKTMGAAGRQYASENDWATILKKFIDIYSDSLNMKSIKY